MVTVKPSLKDTREAKQTLYFCDNHLQHSRREFTSLSYLICLMQSLEETSL